MQASGQKAAPRREANPRGPVEPQDIPDVGAIPVGENMSVGIEGGDAVISTEINGSRIDLRVPIANEAPPEPVPAPP